MKRDEHDLAKQVVTVIGNIKNAASMTLLNKYAASVTERVSGFVQVG